MKKGQKSYVSRSVYMKADIYKMIMGGINPEGILIRVKWKEKFAKEKAFNAAMKKAVQDYLELHPEEKALIESFANPPQNIPQNL